MWLERSQPGLGNVGLGLFCVNISGFMYLHSAGTRLEYILQFPSILELGLVSFAHVAVLIGQVDYLYLYFMDG